MKRIAAAVIFFVAGPLSAGGIHAATPDPRPLGRPSSTAPDSRKPQANPAARTAAGDPVALNEGFELVDVMGAGMFANGWLRQNNSDKPSGYWGQCVSTSGGGIWNAADGPDNSCALATYGSTRADGGTISNWIATPVVNFAASSTVSFDIRTKPGSQYPDRVQVRACTSGPCTNLGTGSEDVGDFTTVLLDINPAETVGDFPEDWTRYTLSFADGVPSSGSGRIAFRHYVHNGGPTGTRGNLVGLDRVVVTTGADAASPLAFNATVAHADASDPNACGSATSIDVTAGDQVNYCYTVTNPSSSTLNYQYLRDDRTGTILTQQPVTLAPGASYQYNRIVTIGESQSPSATWTAQVGPWGYTYTKTPAPANLIDISDGTPIPIQAVPQTLPFPADFNFLLFGQRIENFCVDPAGIFELVHDYCGGASGVNGQGIPNDGLINAPSLLPFWQVFASAAGETLFYKVVGTAPNRQFIVEWKDYPIWQGSGTLSMEAILQESTNVIEFRYGGDYATASASAIGLQNQWMGNEFSRRTQSLAGIGSIVWTPAVPTAYTATRKVTVNAAVPALGLGAASLAVRVPSQGSASTSLAVGNAGSGRLDWSVHTAAASNLRAMAQTVTPIGNPALTSFGHPQGAASSQARPASAGNAPATTLDAYAVDLGQGPYLWHFDPENVNDAPPIAGYMPSNSMFAGATFLDDDFSKLYVYDSANMKLFWLDVTRQYASVNYVGTTHGVLANAVTGMKQDPTTGTVYLSTADGQTTGLWTINPATADVTPVGTTTDAPGVIDIAFDAQGNLYGVDIVLDALVAIDKTTGVAQPIGSIGFDANCAAGLAFDYATGKLYFTSLTSCVPSTEAIYSIDTATGLATQISPITGIDGTGVPVWDAVAIAHPAGNPCVDPASVPWLSFDPAMGSVQGGASPTNVQVSFDASGLADGTYTANLCVYSNDPLHRHESLPVTFTVGGADRIFADGFDGGSP